MPIWRCPHCNTPQAETARCWVCRRSSTTCSTCRHFRRSLASNVGFCGLDRKRAPLTGRELRGCWEAGLETVPSTTDRFEVIPDAGPARRGFVPVELVQREETGSRGGARDASGGLFAPDAESSRADRLTLFGDPEI
jgi:hypothetical protein